MGRVVHELGVLYPRRSIQEGFASPYGFAWSFTMGVLPIAGFGLCAGLGIEVVERIFSIDGHVPRVFTALGCHGDASRVLTTCLPCRSSLSLPVDAQRYGIMWLDP